MLSQARTDEKCNFLVNRANDLIVVQVEIIKIKKKVLLGLHQMHLQSLPLSGG